MAVLVRIAIDDSTPQANKDLNKYLEGMRNNFPNALRVMSTNEKRAYFKKQGLLKPPGVVFSELPMGADGPQGLTAAATDAVLTKLVKALHYKHTGRILPKTGTVILRWLTNIDFHRGHEYQFFLDEVRGVPKLARGNRDLSKQFFYRFAIDPKHDGSAFMLLFRNSLVCFAIAVERVPGDLPQESS